MTGLTESWVCLQVSLRVRDLLRNLADVRLTRDTDIDVPLNRRTPPAGTSAFVSIHCNAFSDRAANGTEVFWRQGSHTDSQRLATILQQNLITALGRRNRGVKTSDFQVLRQSTMPAALVELAFISNQEEEALLRQERTHDLAARAIADALIAFLGIVMPQPVVPIKHAPPIQPVVPIKTAKPISIQGDVGMHHIVQRGETLSRIATMHNTTWQNLATLNNIQNPSRLTVGQRLIVRNPAPQPTPTATTGQITHTQVRHPVGNLWTNVHVFSMPRNTRARVVGTVPGTIRPTRQRGELVINGGFFWDGHPIGPTAINGVRHGFEKPNFFPLDLDRLEFVSATAGTNVVSVYPRLVVGGVARHTTVEAYLKPRHPRTAIGWNNERMFIVVADGRTPQSAGLTMQQLAEYMRSLGCTEAANLDGGGSSVAVYNGQIVNRPSDGSERPVVTAIVFNG